MKLVFSVCLVLGLALAHVHAGISTDCPDTEDVVWAVGHGCKVFRNKCYFDKENGHRKPRKQQNLLIKLNQYLFKPKFDC